MKDTLRVTVYDGKYTVVMDAGGRMRALRHGEEWRDLTGDGLVLALAQEIEELRDQLRRLHDDHQDAADVPFTCQTDDRV